MTGSPISEPLKSSEPAQAPGFRATGQQQGWDYWVLVGLLLTVLGVLLACFFSLSDRIDGLYELTATRIDALAARIDGLEASLSTRIDALAARVDDLEASLSARVDGLYELLLTLKR